MAVGRAGGETKTRSSLRTLALPHRAIVALREQHDRQTAARQRAGAGWAAHDVVFASANGAALDSDKVRRGLRNIAAAGGLDPDAWTPRELRHSCVSLLSDEGVPIEQIARLIGRRIEGHRGRLPQTTATGRRRGRDSHEPRLPGRPWP